MVERASSAVILRGDEIDGFVAAGASGRVRPRTLNDVDRKTYGRPDEVEVTDGALFPVEVKHRKHVRSSDRIELAF